MDAEKIAREDVIADILVADGRTGISHLISELSDFVTREREAAHRAGYEEARKQAAGVLRDKCHDNMTRGEEAALIMAMEPEG